MTYKAEAPGKKVDQIGSRPRRFWKETATVAAEGGFAVHLDGRPVKTPQGHLLVLPTRALAQQVEAEWAAVADQVAYDAMPLTRLGFAAADRMDEVLDATVAEVLRYAETDLLCYPSEYPAALIERENAAWQPVLAWAEDELGLVFHQNASLMFKPQPLDTSNGIQSLIRGASAYERAGLMAAMPLFGSVILALAVWKGFLTGEQAFMASRVGEEFQLETWGRDEEAAQRAESMKSQAHSLDVWFRNLA